MISFRKLLVNLNFINSRYYATKYVKSLIDYRQMPDIFYIKKKKKLPQKLYTALVNVKDDFDDVLTRFLMNLHFRYDFTFPSLLTKAMITKMRRIKKQQMIPSEAIDDYGVELCVAHLVVYLGGAVKLNGSDQWIGRIQGARNLLPKMRMKDFRVEGIDLSGTNITYEGLEFLPSLNNLKELQLGTTPFVDDHCLRRIARLRRNLEYLDISNCPQITAKGVAALWSVRQLKILNVSNNPLLEDKELICLLLAEKIPQLQIRGVDYLSALDQEQRARILAIMGREGDGRIEGRGRGDSDGRGRRGEGEGLESRDAVGQRGDSEGGIDGRGRVDEAEGLGSRDRTDERGDSDGGNDESKRIKSAKS